MENSAFAGMALLFILIPANVIGNHMGKVNEVRDKEVKTIKQYAVMNVTFSTVPLLVTLCTFMVYIYLDPINNICVNKIRTLLLDHF